MSRLVIAHKPQSRVGVFAVMGYKKAMPTVRLCLRMFTFLILMPFLASCRGTPPARGGNELPTLFAAGSLNAGEEATPVLWEGSREVDLPLAGLRDVQVSSVFPSPWGAVYIGGWYSNGDKSVPCRWVGGQRTDLSYGVVGRVLSLFVSPHGWSYAAGFTLQQGGSKQVPCYWAGSARFDLPASEAGAALGIFVSEGTVYTSGFYKRDFKFFPCYWVGNKRIDLPCSQIGGVATAVIVNRGSAWVAGSDGAVPCYWQGTVETTLSGIGEASSLFVDEGTVYTAGQSNGEACYWTNDKVTTLAVEGSGSSVALSILVKGGTVYVGGTFTTLEGKEVLSLWTDGARRDLTSVTQSAKINSVVLR